MATTDTTATVDPAVKAVASGRIRNRRQRRDEQPVLPRQR